MTDSPAPLRLSFADADARVDGALSAAFEGDYRDVVLFDGDLTVDGDFLSALEAMGAGDADIIAVAGDLTVDGPIALYETTPGLWVGGRTRGETLEGGDCEIYIGEGEFTYLVYGYYNDGILETGTVRVPWVVNDNHDLRVSASDAKMVDNHGDDDDDADFDRSNIAASFVPEVVDPKYDNIRVDVFLERLRAGQPVLSEGARTVVEATLDVVAVAAAERRTELDLTGRKLSQFPTGVLAMPWLKKLILDDNPIGELPDEIGALSDLEFLSVRSCGLAALPESIGRLSKLRVLRIDHNGRYEFPKDRIEIVYRPMSLPDSIGDLSGLEELHVCQLSYKPISDTLLPELTPFVLPESVGRLPRLRRLLADHTNVVLPASLAGSRSLREVSMGGTSSAYLRRFPERLTQAPHITTLNLSGNYFDEIPPSLLNLTELEELNLNDSLALVKAPLPDLSRLPALRVLRLNGLSGHTRVPAPPHSLLRGLFAMNLTRLEELSIDRWGDSDKGGRTRLTADIIAGIGSLRTLTRLDLSFNGLTSLPDDFYTLPNLTWIDLRYNALPRDVRQRVAAAYPNAHIDFRDQGGADNAAERKAARAVSSVIADANTLRDQRRFADALAAYDAAIAQFTDGSVDSPNALLYAHYGKLWIHSTLSRDTELTAADRADHALSGVIVGEECLRLVPPVWTIFHFTDEGQFQREVVCDATNHIAWQAVVADPPADQATLELRARTHRARSRLRGRHPARLSSRHPRPGAARPRPRRRGVAGRAPGTRAGLHIQGTPRPQGRPALSVVDRPGWDGAATMTRVDAIPGDSKGSHGHRDPPPSPRPSHCLRQPDAAHRRDLRRAGTV